MVDPEIKNEQAEHATDVEKVEVAKYTFFNWALFALPGVMLFYPFKWIFQLVFGVMEDGNQNVRDAREKDEYHNRRVSNAYKRDSATGVGLINLLVVITLVAVIYMGAKLGLDATMYLFTIKGTAFVLPIYFMGLYSAFKSSVLNDFARGSEKLIHYVIWSSIPLTLLITFYVWTQGAFKLGNFYLGAVFAPLFIFGLFVFPFILSLFSLFIYLKVSSKISKFKLAVILSGCFSLLASSATYFIVTETSIGTQFANIAAEKWPEKAEEGPSPHELHRMKIEENHRLTEAKAQEEAEMLGGYESYPRSMVKKISSIHNGQPEALKAMSANKGKGVVDVYIQPFPFNNGKIKIAVEGIERYEYGMQMTPGTRKVTIIQEGYKTVEFNANMDEGGFYETVTMEPLY